MMVAVALTVGVLTVSACGGSGADAFEPPSNEELVDQARNERAVTLAVENYLLVHGGARAVRDDPMGYWIAGDVYLPAGGRSCSVNEIFVDDAAEVAVNAVRDPTGAVAVKVSANAADNARCLEATAAALEGFVHP